MKSDVHYLHFALYYVEIFEHLVDLNVEVNELNSKGEEASSHLSSEIYRHEIILEILIQGGNEMFDASPEQMYIDGWKVQKDTKKPEFTDRQKRIIAKMQKREQQKQIPKSK